MSTIFSFFSGAGFLDLGFEETGFRIAFTNENHQPFADAYKCARKALNVDELEFDNYAGSIVELVENPRYLRDLIRLVRQKEDLVGFIGGPPCPDFSIGGKNKGRHGDNGALSAAYVQLIIDQKPDFFLFENVKGLWRTKKHRSFYEELKTQLHEAGYITTENVINAIEYGVPQDRDRIILVGFRQDILFSLGIYTIKPNLEDGLFKWDFYKKYEKKRVMSHDWPSKDLFYEDSYLSAPDGIITELTVEHWFRRNCVDLHANSGHHFQPRAGLQRMLTVDEGDDSKKSYKRLHRWRYSPTAAYGNNEVHLHPYKARRISAAEALAIQSMPASFTLPDTMTLTNMFKTIGNGVPYLAAQALSNTLRLFLGLDSYESAKVVGSRLGEGN